MLLQIRQIWVFHVSACSIICGTQTSLILYTDLIRHSKFSGFCSSGFDIKYWRFNVLIRLTILTPYLHVHQVLNY